jgi:hypothetical protein
MIKNLFGPPLYANVLLWETKWFFLTCLTEWKFSCLAIKNLLFFISETQPIKIASWEIEGVYLSKKYKLLITRNENFHFASNIRISSLLTTPKFTSHSNHLSLWPWKPAPNNSLFFAHDEKSPTINADFPRRPHSPVFAFPDALTRTQGQPQ